MEPKVKHYTTNQPRLSSLCSEKSLLNIDNLQKDKNRVSMSSTLISGNYFAFLFRNSSFLVKESQMFISSRFNNNIYIGLIV